MGQYHYIINLDKKEYLHPHRFDDGLKLLEFGASAGGTMAGLAILLACSCKGGSRGGGDVNTELAGRWAGDRIAIIGDYAEPDDLPEGDAKAIIHACHDEGGYKDISTEVVAAVHNECGDRGKDDKALSPDILITQGGQVLSGKAAAAALKKGKGVDRQ